MRTFLQPPTPGAARPAPPPGRSPRRGAGAGSAYLITLLVLVVLTILGISLSMVTQTEMQIGANERTVQRVFYAADSGIAVATARALVTGDHSRFAYEIPDGSLSGGSTFTNRVDASPLLPIQEGYCNLCAINQGSDFYQINHALTTYATREGTDGGDTVVQAEKVIAVMVSVQPWERSIVAMSDADIARIKF